jgi:hypothetical protein
MYSASRREMLSDVNSRLQLNQFSNIRSDLHKRIAGIASLLSVPIPLFLFKGRWVKRYPGKMGQYSMAINTEIRDYIRPWRIDGIYVALPLIMQSGW